MLNFQILLEKMLCNLPATTTTAFFQLFKENTSTIAKTTATTLIELWLPYDYTPFFINKCGHNCFFVLNYKNFDNKTIIN